MNIEKILRSRSDSKCELCGESENLTIYEVPPGTDAGPDECVLICATCHEQIGDQDKVVAAHWRCLNDSMWSQTPAVQVVVWRMLNRLIEEGWPRDLLEMLHLDEATEKWARATVSAGETDGGNGHVDSNGAPLKAGDTVTLIKDLNVKGANFTAKRGTVVRGISVVDDNREQIEGRINGQKIVLLTKFVKKST